MTVKEFIYIAKLSNDLGERIKKLKKPDRVKGRKTPETLNDISMGDYLMLQSIRTDDDFLFIPCEVLFGMVRKETLKADAYEVVSFSAWCINEVNRISKMFSKTSVPATEEEKQAGVEKLNFGAFGLIDYFALRMGIDHEAAEKTPWVRVYKCLEIDSKQQIYRRRLNNILARKRKGGKK